MFEANVLSATIFISFLGNKKKHGNSPEIISIHMKKYSYTFHLFNFKGKTLKKL